MATVKVKKLDRDIPTPSYAHAGDAGFDLFTRERVVIGPRERVQVPTGIALEIPEGHAGLIWDKSGLSHKQGLKTLGGVIDAIYRGEVFVGVVNLGSEEYILEKYHKVAQMLIQKVEQADIRVVEELANSPRGEKGFGSSGK